VEQVTTPSPDEHVPGQSGDPDRPGEQGVGKHGAPLLDKVALQAIEPAIGNALQAVRIDHGWNALTFAARVNLSSAEWSRIEHGQRTPHLRRLILIAATMRTRPSDVFRYAEDEAFPMGFAPWPAESVDLAAVVRAVWPFESPPGRQ
jgi:transcriptional regulator with XRE-family HTH domain